MSDPNLLYSLITEIFLILDDGNRRFLSRYDLTPARFYALVHLGEEAGLSLSELSERLICDKSNTSRIIKSMEKNQLITRKPHESDGRAMRLYLTREGEQLRKIVIKAHDRYNNERLSGVAEFDKDNFSENLFRLKNQLAASLNSDGVNASGSLN